VLFLSERDGGSMNVWKQPASAGAAAVAVTRHGPHPVRFLSAAADGTIAYAFDGSIWVMRPDGDPRRLRVDVALDDRVNPERRTVEQEGATEFAVSPDEEEVCFVLRGELFVASVEHGTTKRITATPTQERSPSWAPDGRTIVFAAERGGVWGLHAVAPAHAEETRLSRATVFAERTLLEGADEAQQPSVSQDGKWVAYLHNRDEIRVLPFDGGEARVLVPAVRNYSYADGDITYAWSPDSRWLAFMHLPKGRWITDIGLVPVEGGAITNATLSGYDEEQPRFSRDGTAVLFRSNRLGWRSHGSWGSENDVFAVDLTRAARDRAELDEEEFALLKKKEEKDKEKAGQKKD
jgi:Tol biopolymer transport system component